ncbi:hypothetical protein phiCbK_235 [Caulobacter phage phiCbK]|uniref:Uncharacterized protein n=5 Tax=Viruses TaxID=10239 RepID=J3SVV3_9CAUD|nr:hypothetical protein D865_gp335 [Caulobacter phage phiCbK]AFO71751.1 hypothetical protein phiCbK_235 [Caulobacter phage phiCbK]AFU86915.1 hypothetical protein CbK_gp083 [Caulobacter phage phiCbK]ARB15001.1 hypothetical protein Ccr32_gp082 [Caulobacter phage Ccr32]ARB15332.1 hypothetical protein Ccr34_gp089 [Caulobacter phage Ccr34]
MFALSHNSLSTKAASPASLSLAPLATATKPSTKPTTSASHSTDHL